VLDNRYLDTSPVIRCETIKHLCSWLVADNNLLESHNSRYIGWALSDKDASVRAEALKTIFKLFQDSAAVQKLDSFTNRFAPRMVDMLNDKDASVRVEAASIIKSLSE